ncbi:MAG: ATP-binding protein [Armatimonadota bacterium]|nr:ATP-binding protein [Armatimonadota bacterium]
MALQNGNGVGNGVNGSGAAVHFAAAPLPLLSPETRTRLAMGAVVRGSLQAGIQMKLTGARSVEEIRAGKFVVIAGAQHEFFAMITDVSLDCVSPNVLADPPATKSSTDAFLRQVLAGTSTFGTVTLKPLLMRSTMGVAEFEPVKTVPTHFSEVGEATQDDIADIFGNETEGGKYFNIGTPLDMNDIPVCLDLEKWVERSNGIFGKSGTGKTFLTRICLCGTIKHQKAVNLVFDMHGEYGWKGTTEDPTREGVDGLKKYFGNRVRVFTLDRESSRRRQVPVENDVRIPYSQISVEDILLLANELNLNQSAAEPTYLLEQHYGKKWLAALLAMDGDALKEFAERSGGNALSLGALKRKLGRMVEECKGFLIESVPGDGDDAVRQIMACLLKDIHVVLEFGNYRKPLQYMLVANILTRQIHHEYTKLMEAAMGDNGKKPTPLVITIEEAHKFLSPNLAQQTTFGTIARELRKYNVTLLVVDQRPSGIDSEVLSQLGTRITCLLNDERDIDAVLTGISGAQSLRGVLASLDSKQQALLMGHAVPMPVVVQSRTYDDAEFKRSMGEFSKVAATVGLDASDWK